MSYTSQETSEFAGRPVELYRFETNAQIFTCTSAGEEIVHNGETYKPYPVGRSDPEQSGSLDRAGITITVPPDAVIINPYIRTAPGSSMSVTIFRQHLGDGEFRTFWQGRAVAVKWPDGDAEIECETMLTALRRAGLQAEFQTSCNFTLYHPGCPVNRANWRATLTVTAINADTITGTLSGSFAAGWFKGGFTETADLERRDVLDHAGSTLTLAAAYPATSVLVGDVINVYAGCDHTWSTCQLKFGGETNNGEAFGGFPITPKRNQFNTGLN